ncbi:hypothetical protein KRR38_33695 [Novosphingobium sp. G106]|uniref:hypothetical protein n=1 Tax=Novosphingobium sp. G106 TaxID=2849500 RepID=UPI001C2D807F|nr:hypothetical protein [Novosphingobium sp. G106]MBV1692189.1 hypothetical protein [Novosphingobium sp. G106]MBV1692459.1 hypothetical protein [Novosphingobium sp. G106]
MDDALAVLRAAVARSHEGLQTGADVRLALRALRFVGIPAEAISYFWRSCQAENEIGRSQSMNAALNRVGLHRHGKVAPRDLPERK